MGSGQPRGFTLIELLIALMIFGLLMTVLASGQYAFLRHFNKDYRQIEDQIGEFRQELKLHNLLESIYPYYVSEPVTKQKKGVFRGLPTELLAVSERSAAGDPEPVLFRLRADKADIDDALFDRNQGRDDGNYEDIYVLTYCERALSAKLLKHPSDLFLECDEKILLTSNEPFRLRYFGWKSLEAFSNKMTEGGEMAMQIGDLAVPPPEWTQVFDGRERNLLPRLVELESGETKRMFWLRNTDLAKRSRSQEGEMYAAR